MSKHPPNYLNIQQNSAQWIFERIGRVTASRAGDVVTKLKSGKYSTGRENYKMELLTEILTGRAFEHYVTAEMQFGIENEKLAREEYAMRYEVQIERIGVIVHPRISRSAASPDALVGDSGLAEFKVPKTTTHLSYLIEDVIPQDYIAQMNWQMACSGRQWCDFVSFDPRLPDDFNMFVKRLHRDEKVLAEMEAEVEKFIGELGEMCDKLLKGKPAPTPMPIYEEAPEDSGIPRAEMPNVEAWLGH